MSGLPEGLVTNTDAIAGDIQQVNRVIDEDIAQLWRGCRLSTSYCLVLIYT